MDRTVGSISWAASKAIHANGGSVIPDPVYPHLLLVIFNAAYVTERHSTPANARRCGSWSEYDYQLADGTRLTVSSHRSSNGYGSSCVFLAEAPVPQGVSLARQEEGKP